MEEICKSCDSCGMVFEKTEDRIGKYCVYCMHKDGSLKSFNEVVKEWRTI